MMKLSSWKTIFFFCVFCATTAITSPAQTGCSVAAPCFTSLVSFNGTDGQAPEYWPPLTQGRDGNFYGTTSEGGASGWGNVFKITAGEVTNLYSFSPSEPNGLVPYPGLVLATNGNFYGTTSNGGANGGGTVFKLSPEPSGGCPSGSNTGNGWCETTLYSFCSKTGCTDGGGTLVGLIQATDGNFYGPTTYGGTNGNNYGTVFVFKVNSTGTGGTLTTLHSFDGTDGYQPGTTLVQATDGNFYGTTSSYYGTVYRITSGGKFATLYGFTDGTDGANPSGLVQASNGNFYGTAEHGGTNSAGTVFKLSPEPSGGCPSGSNTGNGWCETTLYSFCSQKGCTDGSVPIGALVQATDGNFYGTTSQGGVIGSCGNYGCGTIFVFKVNSTGTGGTLTTLHSFDFTDGATPQAGLMQATNGKFYGTTTGGGANNAGTVFSLSVGLGPFVEAVTYSGVGNTIVEFLGQGFTSSSAVYFNGTNSPTVTVPPAYPGTYLTATVPNGATTGYVTVTTSGGTLKSNKIFRVIPQITGFSPTSGPTGTSVVISGESFTGATSVTFGGVKATFTVNSYTEITATVPSGAKTGKITVTTPGGTATSSGIFTVT